MEESCGAKKGCVLEVLRAGRGRKMAVWKWIVETAATWTAVGIWIRLLFSLAVGMFIGIDRGLKRRGVSRRMCWSAWVQRLSC